MATGRFTVSHHRQDRLEDGTVPIMGIKTERRAAREPVSPYQRRSWPGSRHVAAAIDRYRVGEIAYGALLQQRSLSRLVRRQPRRLLPRRRAAEPGRPVRLLPGRPGSMTPPASDC
jgi:hypothetical protein